jgi:glycolate oxidase
MTQTAGADVRERLIDAIGSRGVLTSPEDLAAYAFDAFCSGSTPTAVVLPESARDVSAAVRIAAACSVPIVPRGAGTGLCGGAIPSDGGIVLSFARMNRILALDARNRRARAQPGLVNLSLSHESARHELFFGPDPSSQKTSTIGGNTATNAGGPHAFAYGSMSAHVVGVEFVDDAGEVFTTSIDDAGYDLTGALVGSEGTLGIITAIDVRLLRLPRAIRVCVAAFGDVASASEAVSAIVAAGLRPTALEIIDRTIVRAVEAHFHAGFPVDAGSVLLVEIAGEPSDVDAWERTLEIIAREHGALSWRSAATADERERLWASRKGAAGALGRIAPNYYIQDATVPRTKLPLAIARIEAIARDHALVVGNVFHAGDGNLHPLLLFDRRDAGAIEAVASAGHDILAACIELGGTISGEHGIGSEKRDALPLIFGDADLATMARVRDVFDVARNFNPDKIFPSGAVCGEVRALQATAAALPAGAWL